MSSDRRSPETAIGRIERRLDVLRWQWSLLVVGGGVLRWLTWVAFLSGGGLILSNGSPRVVRVLLLAAWVISVVALGYREWARASWKHPSRHEMAGYVEEAYPSARQRFLSALQLHDERAQAERLGYDPALLRMSIEDGLRVVDRIRSTDVLAQEWRAAQRSVVLAGVATAFMLLLFASGIASERSIRAWIRAPRETFIVQIGAVEPGDTTANRGDDVSVRAEIVGARPSDVALDLRENGGDWQSVPMQLVQGQYTATILNVVAPLEYRVRAKEKTSATYTIAVATPPVVESLAVTLHFPEYSGLGEKRIEPNQGDITALVGTRVSFGGRSAVPLSQAVIDFEDLNDVALTVDGDAFSGEFSVTRSGRYALRLVGTDGLTNVKPPQYVVYAVKDEFPSVTVLRPGTDTTLDNSMIVPIEIEAVDDYGISQVTLRYRHENREEEGSVRLETFREATPLARVRNDWDLSALDLIPDDTVSYFIEVFDNDTVSGPKRAVSPTYTVRFPSMVEMFDEIVESQNVQTEMLGSMRDAQTEANDIVDSLIDRVRKSQELTLRDRKDLERAIEMQQQIEQKRKQLAENIAKVLQEAEKSDLMSIETLDKIAEMRRLLDEVASKELKEALRALQKALEEKSLTGQQQKLMAANFKQEEFRQRIEQMIKALEKMKRQQELEKAFKLAESLAEQQKDVVERTEELNRSLGETPPKASSPEAQKSERLAQQESAITKQTDDLDAQMEKAARALSEDDTLKKVADEVQRLLEQARRSGLKRSLGEAQEQFAQRNPQAAQSPATSALEQLERLRQGLDNTMEFMRGQNGEAMMAALQDAVREVLYLSRSHEAVADRVAELSGTERTTTPSDPMLEEFALKERTLADGVNAVGDVLQGLSESDIQVPLELMWRLRQAADALARSSRAFAEGELNRALPIQRQALGELNRAALQMLDTMDAMNAQTAGSGMQNMLEQLQQLGESQGDLNRLAERIEQMMREQGRSASADRTLERMAFEQGLIRQAYENLAKKLQEMNEMLGETEGIGGEMENVEKRLSDRELNRDLLQRMRRIETRMLESAKALQKRQTGKSRKATVAKQFFGEQVGTENAEWDRIRDVFDEELGQMSDAEQPEAYRPLIRAYFRALADEKGSGDE